ncbi:MAG: YgcG family protein [Desulfobacterales bacterium]
MSKNKRGYSIISYNTMEQAQNIRKRILRLAVIAIALLLAVIAAGADIPFLSGRVTDNAEILTDGMRRTLTERLKSHEERTGNQIAILTVPSLGGENIEEYASTVFGAWKLGQKGRDNGVLVIVVPNDRRMRIEVGYGLEGTLTDLVAGRIIRNIMAPLFKKGDFDGGLEGAVKAIIGTLEGSEVQEISDSASPKGNISSGFHIEEPDLPIIQRILFGAFIFGIIGLFTVIGVLTPGAGWFLYFFLIPFWAMFPIIIVGTRGALYLLTTYVICFPIAKLLIRKTDWYEKAHKSIRKTGKATIGGFTVTSGGSGSSWSSGGSGGGFSGGGGSSGGGGASGSW